MTEEMDAILFDAGGTLMTHIPSKEEVFQRVLSKHGFDARLKAVESALAKADGAFDGELAKLDGRGEDDFWRRYDKYVLDELGASADLDGFLRDASAAFDEIIPVVSSWILYPEVKPVLRLLRKRDFKLGVISNATSMLRNVMDNLGLNEFFDLVVISQEVGVNKPSSKIFDIAAERAGVRPSRALYVGDKYALDVVAARKAGMHAMLVDRTGAYPHARCIKVRDLNFFRHFA